MKFLRNRWFRRIAAAVALLAVVWVAVVAFLWLNVRKAGEARLARVVAELDATDPGWRTADLEAAHNAAVAPPEQNAGEQALAAVALRSAEYQDFKQRTGPRSLPGFPFLPQRDQLISFRSVLQSTAPAIEKVRSIRRFTGGGFRFAYAEPNSYDTRDDQDRELYRAFQLLDDSRILAAVDNKADDALDAILCAMHLDTAMGDMPLSSSHESRVMNLAMAAVMTQEVLFSTTTATEAKLAELQAELLRLAETPRLKIALRGVRGVTYRVLENLENGTLDPKAIFSTTWSKGDQLQSMSQRRYWPGQKADALALLTRLVSVADLPPEQRAEARKRVLDTAGALIGDDAKYPTSAIVPVAIINTSQLFETDTRAIGLLRATATAVACERYRLKHDRYPTTLTELTPAFLTAVPTDSYTGKSILYKPDLFNPVVYTTGADCIDNGGAIVDPKAESGGDVGFKLFNPLFRRQPLPKSE